ncbi:tRNA (adenosine(37)-N6)-threonylcarbamoyltransferase complex dimerization subunit type 1 TsaB [Subsaxibacter sp. CAU 1640]|uniref:tRNA (adenosine(37)-N6)-threonylcarbamoyltransferase complex dimerization subunit type 1 TsaB n=1 Tax=Subsaxibacter sp. CAU 1640 TaxID=2933271 RepID=UPI00200505A2|nr:tRNA (adenosine(37)-N6)-threonylcarbamoyltransferase complex dimerization subunit type 1 TsaB [Subsaxibacter sp. CAU 1640]MCK7589817.1 tRNA (adenosine(37)-N6)-threonylcarbamoyltransferase complex dimerization subunit type 1 TsaB [Subsaxibacter sp. CAU 1640]
MAYILNIETATTNCSVSLSKDGETLVLKEDNNLNYSHAESLHVYIDEVLKSVSLKASQLDAIAVSKGPGSYTGLRIGVSAAKGLCYALNIPLISVDTLHSLAHKVLCKGDDIIVPMLDARRMEVYSAIYDSKYFKIRDTEAQILNEDSFKQYLEKHKVHFIGNGVDKLKTMITHYNSEFIGDKLPSASEMGMLAYDKYKKNDIEDVAYFEPYYLKEFIGLRS